MFRSSQHIPAEPVYRDVLRHAFHAAWSGRRYWLLSIIAGLLVTAGSYDILYKAVNNISQPLQSLNSSPGGAAIKAIFAKGVTNFDTIIALMGGLQLLLLVVFVLLVIGGLSCAAQGGLVFALGAKRRGDDPGLLESFRVGASALVPIAVLNITAMAVLWVLRFFAAFPVFLALPKTSSASTIVYTISFLVFVPLSFLVSVIQILALNAMILQGASLKDALLRGVEMCRRHWLVMIETALLQIAITFGIFITFIVAGLFAAIPFFLTLLASAVTSSSILFQLSLAAAAILFMAALLATAAFSIQFQYATWTYLYRRLGEGGVLPKLHRILRSLTGSFSVPQA